MITNVRVCKIDQINFDQLSVEQKYVLNTTGKSYNEYNKNALLVHPIYIEQPDGTVCLVNRYNLEDWKLFKKLTVPGLGLFMGTSCLNILFERNGGIITAQYNSYSDKFKSIVTNSVEYDLALTPEESALRFAAVHLVVRDLKDNRQLIPPSSCNTGAGLGKKYFGNLLLKYLLDDESFELVATYTWILNMHMSDIEINLEKYSVISALNIDGNDTVEVGRWNNGYFTMGFRHKCHPGLGF